MKIKNKLLVIMLITFLGITLVGCGFNEDKAKTDSKQQLESFLKLYKNKTVIMKAASDGNIDKQKLKQYIDKNFKNYFTKDFLNDTKNQIESGDLQNGKTFYIFSESPISNIIFRNNYLIDSPVVNKDNETVEYKIKGNDLFAESTVDIIMKQEDGKWKVDKAN